MKYHDAQTTLIDSLRLPEAKALLAELFDGDAFDRDEFIATESSAGACWAIDIESLREQSRVRVTAFSRQSMMTENFIRDLATSVQAFQSVEGGIADDNTPQCKKAVLEHLRDTKFVVQTEMILAGNDNFGWDMEYGIHISLSRLCATNTVNTIIFFSDRNTISFADEVSGYLSYEDSTFGDQDRPCTADN